jgi:hypothetical protein
MLNSYLTISWLLALAYTQSGNGHIQYEHFRIKKHSCFPRKLKCFRPGRHSSQAPAPGKRMAQAGQCRTPQRATSPCFDVLLCSSATFMLKIVRKQTSPIRLLFTRHCRPTLEQVEQAVKLKFSLPENSTLEQVAQAVKFQVLVQN